MRIALDTTPISSAHKDRGVGSYTALLKEALADYGKGHEWIYFKRGQPLPKGIDIVHYPYFDPFFLTLPLVKPYPTIVTVHDLTPLVFPDKFPPGIAGTVKWQIQRRSLKGSRNIITDSYASKRDIERLVEVTGGVQVVYLAPSSAFAPRNQKQVRQELERTHGLSSPYILYVGDVNWNKNVPSLIDAFAQVKKTSKMESLRLVLIGRSFLEINLAETISINKRIEAHALSKYIVRPGYVEFNELIKFYSGCGVYVQPSYYEGFGLPVLEAMACGSTVVSSSAGSLPEIAGPAIMVDPYDISDIARGILLGLKQGTVYPNKQSLDWVKQFTWKRVVQETVAVYEKALV